MIPVNDRVSLNEEEIDYEFVRSSGPGGQNVNKVSTVVQLRFDVLNSPSLPEDVKARLQRIAQNKISAAGVLLIDSRGTRSQLKNKEEALERLVRLVDQACKKAEAEKKDQTLPGIPAAPVGLQKTEIQEKAAQGQGVFLGLIPKNDVTGAF